MQKEDLEIDQVGQKIKHLRELRNYTQEYMASKLGLSLNGYGKIEREQTSLTLSRLSEITQILGVKILDLFGFNTQHLFFNKKTYDTSAGTNVNAQQSGFSDNERNQYEARIADLQKEVAWLRALLEKHLAGVGKAALYGAIGGENA